MYELRVCMIVVVCMNERRTYVLVVHVLCRAVVWVGDDLSYEVGSLRLLSHVEVVFSDQHHQILRETKQVTRHFRGSSMSAD